MKSVTIIGGGLAGCEAAWQAASRGTAVTLHEMKPEKFSPAHHLPGLAELVSPTPCAATPWKTPSDC